MQKPTSHAVLILLLLQLGTLVAPLAHGEAEAIALTTPLHISSEVDHGCPAHVDDLCQICRSSIRAPESATRTDASLRADEQRVTEVRFLNSFVPRSRVQCRLGPRAPPALP